MAYVTIRNKLCTAIKSLQEMAWSELCDVVDSDPWGIPYCIVSKKRLSRDLSELTVRGKKGEIANHIFPYTSRSTGTP